MEETKRQARNQAKLKELYPTFRVKIAAIIADLEAQGVRPRIQDAWRSPEAQQKAYETGHSKLRYGFHNVTGANGEKEAVAVDVLDDNAPLNPAKGYLLKLAIATEKQGLMTGIRWGLNDKMSAAIDQAIIAGKVPAGMKTGWDPCHIEPTGITWQEAKAGQRPV